jgi:hypothetical protein
MVGQVSTALAEGKPGKSLDENPLDNIIALA